MNSSFIKIISSLILCFTVTACQSLADSQSTIGLNQEFALKIGQEKVIKNETLQIKFQAVLEDSRCPLAVNCAWTGQARIAIAVQQASSGAAPSILELDTNPAQKERATTTYNGYKIELKRLDPYPEKPEEVPIEDYKASFVIQNN